MNNTKFQNNFDSNSDIFISAYFVYMYYFHKYYDKITLSNALAIKKELAYYAEHADSSNK